MQHNVWDTAHSTSMVGHSSVPGAVKLEDAGGQSKITLETHTPEVKSNKANNLTSLNVTTRKNME